MIAQEICITVFCDIGSLQRSICLYIAILLNTHFNIMRVSVITRRSQLSPILYTVKLKVLLDNSSRNHIGMLLE